MKEIFFRIIETPTHQVLIEKDFDSDGDETDIIVITFFVKGVKCKHSFSYENEEKRDLMFEKITENQVQKMIINAEKLF